MQHWYVYFKLPVAQVQQWSTCVHRLFDLLAAGTGVRGRLQRRIGTQGGPDGVITLMETYSHIEQPCAFQSAYDAAVAAAGFSAEQIAARHIERFEDF
jgi:hypothetical protein